MRPPHREGAIALEGFSAGAARQWHRFRQDLQDLSYKTPPTNFEEFILRTSEVRGLCDTYALFFTAADPVTPELLDLAEWASGAIDSALQDLLVLEDDPTVQAALDDELLTHYRRLTADSRPVEEIDTGVCYAALAYPWLVDEERLATLLFLSLRSRVVVGEMDGLAVIRGPQWLISLLSVYSVRAEVVAVQDGTASDVLAAALTLWEPLEGDGLMHDFAAAFSCAELLLEH